MLNSHSPLDVGFVTEERGIIEPLDTERFYRTGRRFLAVATNCNTGKATCFEKGKTGKILAGVRASATMPFISPMVPIGEGLFLDGGCACKIPYQWALQNGYEKILVIRTREKEFRKPDRTVKAALRYYRDYPEFAGKLAASNRAYNHQCDEIERLHAEGRLLRLAPSETVTVSRVERDMEKLGDLYWLGYRDCLAQLDEIRSYLGA